MCPAAFDRKTSSNRIGGDAHIAPPFGRDGMFLPTSVGAGVPDGTKT